MKNQAKMASFELGFDLLNANFTLNLPFFKLEKVKAPIFHLVLDSKENLFYVLLVKSGLFSI